MAQRILDWCAEVMGLSSSQQQQEKITSGTSGRRASKSGGNLNPIESDSSSRKEKTTDFVLEAQRLFASFGVSMTTRSTNRVYDPEMASAGDDSRAESGYRILNVIWKHPKTDACMYVGNERCASNKDILHKNKITNIVNCTKPAGRGTLPNYFENTGRFRYLDFPAARWDEYVLYEKDGTEVRSEKEKFKKLMKFMAPLLAFVYKALNKGENVLIHCLAGAHRAGTTGILCLMRMSGLSSAKATRVAKSIRPCIDPISDFPDLLLLFERCEKLYNVGQQPTIPGYGVDSALVGGGAGGNMSHEKGGNTNSKTKGALEAARLLSAQTENFDAQRMTLTSLLESRQNGPSGRRGSQSRLQQSLSQAKGVDSLTNLGSTALRGQRRSLDAAYKSAQEKEKDNSSREMQALGAARQSGKKDRHQASKRRGSFGGSTTHTLGGSYSSFTLGQLTENRAAKAAAQGITRRGSKSDLMGAMAQEIDHQDSNSVPVFMRSSTNVAADAEGGVQEKRKRRTYDSSGERLLGNMSNSLTGGLPSLTPTDKIDYNQPYKSSKGGEKEAGGLTAAARYARRPSLKLP